MIEKLFKLGKLIPSDKLEINPYRLDLDEHQDWKVIILDFSLSKEGIVKYKGSIPVDYIKGKNFTHWYFKRVSANAVSEFPSVFCKGGDLSIIEPIEGKKQNKKYWRKLIRVLKNSAIIEPDLEPLSKYCETYQKDIFDDLLSYNNDKNASYVLTININNDSIGESILFSKVRDHALREIFKEYYTLGNKQIKKKNKICSVCMLRKPEIWGYPSVFNFYAAKTEFAPITSGFKKEEAWKNYSICPECSAILDKAKYFIEKKLNFSFCGFKYFLIPEFLNNDDESIAIKDAFSIICDPETAIGKFKLNKQRDYLTQDENEILDIVKESNNQVNYTLFFYQQDQSKFSILLNVEDIFPSEFRKIFDAKERAENHSIFKNIKGINTNEEVENLRFSFELIKSFMPFNNKIAKVMGDFSKSFLEIVRNVFQQRRIEYKFLLRRIVDSIQHYFINNYNYVNLTLKTFLVLNFLNELEVLCQKGKIINQEVFMNNEYQKFFDEFSDFFNSNAKKAVFLEGVLCQKLLSIQYSERKATPFRKKLKGLKLNPKTVRRLFPEMIEKLEQYKKNYYRNLESEIASLMITTELERLSNDEISYYFVLGMSLNNRFKQEKEVSNET